MEQTLATNTIKKKIFKLNCSPLCRLCQQKDETVLHIISKCPKLAGTKYTKRHNYVARYIHWYLLKKRGIEVAAQWWNHVPIASVINGDTTITWDLKIITDKSLKHNRPDIVLHNKKEGWAQILDIAVLYDTTVVSKTAEKITKYRDLEISSKQNWEVCKIQTIPIVIGTFGTVCKNFIYYLKKVSPHNRPDVVQKTAVLGTVYVLRHVLTDNMDL
eukprot:10121941-Ditylum_brightwellii.AAC.1